jgi:hypothetical protein
VHFQGHASMQNKSPAGFKLPLQFLGHSCYS